MTECSYHLFKRVVEHCCAASSYCAYKKISINGSFDIVANPVRKREQVTLLYIISKRKRMLVLKLLILRCIFQVFRAYNLAFWPSVAIKVVCFVTGQLLNLCIWMSSKELDLFLASSAILSITLVWFNFPKENCCSDDGCRMIFRWMFSCPCCRFEHVLVVFS